MADDQETGRCLRRYWRRPCGGHGRSRLVLHAYLYNNFFFLTPYLAFFRGALQLISTTTPPETPSETPPETGSTTTPSSTEITAIYNGIKSDFTTDDSKINAAGRLDVFTSPPLPLGLDKTKLLSSITTSTISSGWKRFTGSATVTGEERKAKVYTYATSKGQKISGSATGTFNNQKVVPSDGLTATDIRIPSFTKTTSTELTLTNQYSSIDGVAKSYSVSGTYDGHLEKSGKALQ